MHTLLIITILSSIPVALHGMEPEERRRTLSSASSVGLGGSEVSGAARHSDPLLQAVEDDDSVALAKLLEGGDLDSMLEVTNQHKETPLITAAIKGSVACTRLLLAHGANINTTNNLGYTPLMLALRNDNKDLAELLVHHERFTAIHAHTVCGDTAAIIAARQGHPDIVQLLIDRGARYTWKNNAKESVRSIVQKKGWALTFPKEEDEWEML